MNTAWSPDSKNITFSDKTGAICLCSVTTGKVTLVDTDPKGSERGVSWSADSKWMAYSKGQPNRSAASAIWIYNVESGKSRQVTSGLFNDSSPVFDHKGDYLYFASNRSFNAPQYDDFDATWIYSATEVLLAAPLRSDIASPLLPSSDEELLKPKEKTSVAAYSSQVQTEQEKTERRTIAADGDEVSGDWKGTAGPIAFTLTLKLGADNKVTGTVDSAQGSGSISGTYNPGAHQLDLLLTIKGGPGVTLTGKIDGATLTGTASAAGMNLDVKATRTSAPTPAPPVAGGKSVTPPGEKAAAAKPVSVSIDFDDFEGRVIPIPVKSGRFGTLGAKNDRNQLLFARMAALWFGSGSGHQTV